MHRALTDFEFTYSNNGNNSQKGYQGIEVLQSILVGLVVSN